jgi:hypothetical protein
VGACTKFTLSDSTLSNCNALNEGGGVRFEGAGAKTLVSLVVTNCTAGNAGTGGSGGAIYGVDQGGLTLSDLHLSGCDALQGAALNFKNSVIWGTAILIDHPCSAVGTLAAIFTVPQPSIRGLEVVRTPTDGCNGTVVAQCGDGSCAMPRCQDETYNNPLSSNLELICGPDTFCLDVPLITHEPGDGDQATAAFCSCAGVAFVSSGVALPALAPYQGAEGCVVPLVAQSLALTTAAVTLALRKDTAVAEEAAVELTLTINGASRHQHQRISPGKCSTIRMLTRAPTRRNRL